MRRTMDTTAIDTTVRAVLATVLERSISMDENVSRDNEPGWDSLKHIEVVFALEGALGVRFSEDELAELVDITSIVAVVERLLAP